MRVWFLLPVLVAASCYYVAGFQDIEPNSFGGGDGATGGSGGAPPTGGGGATSSGTGGSGAGGATGGTGGSPFPHKTVFVTSEAYLGDMTGAGGGFVGIDAADAICAQSAQAGGLDGSFVAYLSIIGGDEAVDRLAGTAGPWWLKDDTPVFASLLAVQMSDLDAPLDQTEQGATLNHGLQAWTGVKGSSSTENACSNWEDATFVLQGWTGRIGETTSQWQHTGNPSTCGSPRHLYCFEL